MESIKYKIEAPQERFHYPQGGQKGQAILARSYGTLFGLPITEPLGQLSGEFPYPARLNDRHVRQLRAANKSRTYGKGTILFEEGSTSDGVYIVLEGRVKLTVNSADGRSMILGFFGVGTVLGLAAAILGRPHIFTADVIQTTSAVFVPRNQLMDELQGRPLAAWQAAQMASEYCYFLLAKMATLELSESAQQKTARFLLGLINGRSHNRAHVALNLSQETIAQMVGLSRETVSRLLSRLRRKGVLDWTRSDFIIRDRQALENLAELPTPTNRKGGGRSRRLRIAKLPPAKR